MPALLEARNGRASYADFHVAVYPPQLTPRPLIRYTLESANAAVQR